MQGKGGKGYYNVQDYNKQKQQQQEQHGVNIPPEANIIAAANHIRALLDGKKFEYGLFGGLAMLCLGSRRKQCDVHIAYDDKNFLRLRQKLENDQRVHLPEGMNSMFPAKILVRTGPAYKDEGCTQAGDVEVNLVPPGSHGTPFNGTIHNNLVLLTMKTAGKPRPFKGLNILHLLKTSVHYCSVQDIAWEPRHDIVFLCQNYGQDIQAMRNLLDQKAVKQNFLGDPYLGRLSSEDQTMCYQVLLGTAPPPRMAIRPPSTNTGRRPPASISSETTRPRLPSHLSNPNLGANFTPALLSPPLPGKVKPTHQRAVSAEVRPSTLPVSNNALAHGRDSRSRYRPISAPGSREGSPNGMHPSTKHDLHPLASNPPDSRQVQQMAQRPQSCLAPVPNITHNRRSMPNLNAESRGPLPPYAFTQTPMLNNAGPLPPVEMAATPVAMSPGQQFLKSQFGLAESKISTHPRNILPMAERPSPPHTRASYQALPAFRAELSATPMPESHMTKDLPTNTVGHHQHREKIGEHDASHYDPKTHMRTDPSHAGAVELDAATTLGQFIAELSVDRATPAPQYEHIHDYPISPPLPHSVPDIKARNSPVSPPQDHAAPAMPTRPLDSTLRPMNPRTQSAPAQALPISLLSGTSVHGLPSSLTIGSPPNQRSHTPTHSSPPLSNTNPLDAAPLKTNASRYTRYSTDPQSQSSQPVTSAYQAYNPSTSPPLAPHSVSPPTDTARSSSFAALKDVDGAGHYFAGHGHAGHGHGHRRDRSHDSHASSASHDSRELADQYRATLGSFEGGYGEK